MPQETEMLSQLLILLSCLFIYRQDKIPIYNYVSSVQKPITWKEFIRLNHKYGIHWPTIRAVWYYSFVAIKSPLMFYIANFFLHTLPGYILDALAYTMGQTPTYVIQQLFSLKLVTLLKCSVISYY